MKISWTREARQGLRHNARYARREIGKKAEQDLHDELDSAMSLLKDNPSLGSIDPLLSHRVQTYRSIIVNRKNKMVYHIEGQLIRIDAFWDTRREPKAAGQSLK